MLRTESQKNCFVARGGRCESHLSAALEKGGLREIAGDRCQVHSPAHAEALSADGI